MDEGRKNAYRFLLYHAMLEIRPLSWLRFRDYLSWNPLRWRRAWRDVRYRGAIAEWHHNLALFAATDFGGFNENWFWQEHQKLANSYPEYRIDRFRFDFEHRLKNLNPTDGQ